MNMLFFFVIFLKQLRFTHRQHEDGSSGSWQTVSTRKAGTTRRTLGSGGIDLGRRKGGLKMKHTRATWHFETHTALKHSPSLQDLRGCLEDRRNLGVQGDPVAHMITFYTPVTHQ